MKPSHGSERVGYVSRLRRLRVPELRPLGSSTLDLSLGTVYGDWTGIGAFDTAVVVLARGVSLAAGGKSG
jgi:hypothetical protein